MCVLCAEGKSLEDMIHVAELCIELLQQNDEHYSEVRYTTYKVMLRRIRAYLLVVCCFRIPITTLHITSLLTAGLEVGKPPLPKPIPKQTLSSSNNSFLLPSISLLHTAFSYSQRLLA